MMQQAKAAIQKMMVSMGQSGSIGPDPYGMIVLNGGFELTIRGILLHYLQQQFPGRIVVAEHTLPGLGDKRADIALLNKRSSHDPMGLIEMKGNFVSQATEITGETAKGNKSKVPGRFESDFEKWKNVQSHPVLFLYLVFEVEVVNPPVFGRVFKPYVVRDKVKNEEFLTRIQDYFEHQAGIQFYAFTDKTPLAKISRTNICGQAFSTTCNYPFYSPTTTIKTHFFLLEKLPLPNVSVSQAAQMTNDY